MSLREQVRLTIIDDGSWPWADRVVEFQGARADQELQPVGQLPFVMLRWISDDAPTLSTATDTANTLSIEVWPHVEEATWVALDALAGQLITMLAQRIILDPESGRRYLSAYAGSPLMDSPARSWDAYARPIRFTLTNLAFMAPQDPVALAMAAWTSTNWPEIQVDPMAWDPSNTEPAVYYEPRSAYVINNDLSTLVMDVYDEILQMHIIAPDLQARVDWTEKVLREMRRAYVPYDGVFLSPVVQTVNLSANPLTDGQVTLRVPYRVLTPEYLAPEEKMRVMHLHDTDSDYLMDVPTQEGTG